MREKLRGLTFDELRALYHELTGKETAVGKGANTVETRAAAFRRLVGKLDRLVSKIAEHEEKEPAIVLDELIAAVRRASEPEPDPEPEQLTLDDAKKPKKPAKKRPTRGRVSKKPPKPRKGPDPRRRLPTEVKGRSRPCRCGKAGMHTCCPRCDESADGIEEIDELFGFRGLRNTAEVTTYRPQTWCRRCRAADVAQRRLKRKESGETSQG